MLRAFFSLLIAATLAACATTPDVFDGADAPRSARVAAIRSEHPVIAIALGSGGARGFAHVGVIRALEEAGIVPDIVTGASSGAVVAALYAGGLRGAELERMALEMDREDVVDFVLFGDGWVRGRALQHFINTAVRNRPIERLDRRLAVVATRAGDRRMTVFNSGDTGVAVRASASVPNLFVPPVIRGEPYIDGGLASPVPVGIARGMGADIVIAVDVSWFAQARAHGAPEAEHLRRRSRYALLEQEFAQADVVVTPHTVRARMLDFTHRAQNIAAGKEAALAAVPELRTLIAAVAARKRALARQDGAAAGGS